MQSHRELTDDQRFTLNQFKEKYPNDSTTALLKLMIYNWNQQEAIKYFKNDKFCHNYCIGKNKRTYGCSKDNNTCQFEHSTNNLHTFIMNSRQSHRNFKNGKLYCLYLMHKQMENNHNNKNINSQNMCAPLFMYYGHLLHKTGNTQQDYLKSQQYFLKSLNIDNKCDMTHECFAKLLTYKLNRYQDAEFHYKQALEIDVSGATRNLNFAEFLVYKQKKYSESLVYSDIACKLRPNDSKAHFLKGLALFELKQFENQWMK